VTVPHRSDATDRPHRGARSDHDARSDGDDVIAEIRALVARADDLHKAAPARRDPEAAREPVMRLLDEARGLLTAITHGDTRRSWAAVIAQRISDLDLEALAPLLEPSADVARAPTAVDDPSRIPPGQHLTAGWPVLHVGPVPQIDPEDVRLTVTGRVHTRTVIGLDALRALPTTTVTRDFHCVTRWSRLDNTWAGVRVRDVLDLADVRGSATHAIVSGHPAYSTNLDVEALRADDCLLAWAHDGRDLPRQHGGPLRLVVPSRYGWKSVKWVFEIRLVDRDVPGYWEERGYHDRGDPWSEERFRGSLPP
jgi:DMSO/TMAO reductase YedYZ molybdopterin-dependent catalytic subunit